MDKTLALEIAKTSSCDMDKTLVLEIAKTSSCDMDGDIIFINGKKYYVHILQNIVEEL